MHMHGAWLTGPVVSCCTRHVSEHLFFSSTWRRTQQLLMACPRWAARWCQAHRTRLQLHSRTGDGGDTARVRGG